MTWVQRLPEPASRSVAKTETTDGKGSTLREMDTRALPAVVLGIGLLLRLAVAWYTFLNPDEAFHYFLANQGSFSAAYRASFSSAHPPLMVLLLYFWHQLGTSEFWLRLPSVISGTLSCWLVYKWLLRIANRTAALSGLILLSISPALISLESELRQYSLLLLFLTCGLYCLERALEENSARWGVLFGLSLWLAIGVHYSGLLFAVTAGIYATVRFSQARPKASLWLTWFAAELGAAILGLHFFRTHISHIKPTMEIVGDTYLKKSTFHAGDHALAFVFTNTYRLFHYIFGNPAIGPAMLALYVIGLFALFRQGEAEAGGNGNAKQLALNLLAPLVFAWAAALAGLYPFGGTRHCVWLAPFIVAGSSLGLNTLFGRRGPWFAAGLMLIALAAPSFPGPSIKLLNQSRTLMVRVVNQIHRDVPPGRVAVIDRQSVYPFRYYFCPSETVHYEANPALFSCGEYRVWQNPDPWMLTGEQLEADLHDAVLAYHVQPGAKILIFQTGWSVNTEPELRARLRQAGCRDFIQSGDNIVACEVQIERDLTLPESHKPLTQ